MIGLTFRLPMCFYCAIGIFALYHNWR